MAFRPPPPLELDSVRTRHMDLLVLQATPFCNLDCSYCYLPHRTDRRRMEPKLLERIFEAVLPTPYVGERLTVVWHAGEPLTLNSSYYGEAMAIAEKFRQPKTHLVHSFQTNGVLIDEAWCSFFEEKNVRPGVSIDGPAQFHDARRRYRSGKGSHADALRGLRLLKERGLPFHVIAVVTAEALDAADEWFEFFHGEGVESVALNVEEVEAANATSSLVGDAAVQGFRRFFSRFVERNEAAGQPVRLREFEGARSAIQYGCGDRHELEPLRILSIDADGHAYTFSPELVGTTHALYGDFSIGDIRVDSLDDLLGSVALRRQFEEIKAGVEQCAARCSYFQWCGGGSPGNKLFENGSLASAETMFCRLTKQGVLEETLTALERRLIDTRPKSGGV